MSGIVMNGRTLTAPITGVQRYALEVLSRLRHLLAVIEPPRPLRGWTGHLWEQVVLPGSISGRLLWSPANTGPVFHDRHVVTIHDCSTLDHPEWYSVGFAALYSRLIPELARRCRRVLVVSESTKRRLLERCRIAEAKIAVIHPGVDERFSAPRSAESPWPGMPSGRFVLSLGSLEPRKNLSRLLEAWSLAKSRLADDIMLVIAGGLGDGAIFAREDPRPEVARVRYCGRVPDDALPALYARALAFVYPSLYEGFGLPVLEAMASGTAVITSNRSSLPEVAGEAAVLIDPMQPEEIADALVDLLRRDDRRAALAQRGRTRAATFTWSRCASGVLSTLREAA